MEWKAKWIKPASETGDVAPVFARDFSLKGKVKKATLFITALGVYEAALNGQRVGKFILAPGWTAYFKRLQYQEYDVTDMLKKDNQIQVTVGKGWYHSPLLGVEQSGYQQKLHENPNGVLVQLEIIYEDRTVEEVVSDTSGSYAK